MSIHRRKTIVVALQGKSHWLVSRLPRPPRLDIWNSRFPYGVKP